MAQQEQYEPQYEPQPAPRRRSRMPWLVAGLVVLVAAVAVGVTLLVTKDDGDSSSSFPHGYGVSASKVIAALGKGACATSAQTGKATWVCTDLGGDKVVLSMFDDETTEDFFVAIVRDRADADRCSLVMPGVVLSGSPPVALVAAVGDVDKFVAEHPDLKAFTVGTAC